MILVRLVILPVRLVLASMRFALWVAYRAGRLAGPRRVVVFAAGVAAGLLLAPIAGSEMRARLRERIGGVPDPELADRVRFELSHAPRTWHLPQPEVEASGGEITLTGDVPHETGRGDLAQAAAAVRGVREVADRLTVATGVRTEELT